MLQVIVYGHNDLMVRGPNSAQKGIVLTVVSAQFHPTNPRILSAQLLDALPRPILPPILHKNDLKILGDLAQGLSQAVAQLLEGLFGSINGNDDRYVAHGFKLQTVSFLG